MTLHASLCLVLHNHQPIGNFDGVFEQAYQDSYLPFLNVFEPYEQVRISLHTSGPLMMWLAERHPEYLDRVRMLVDVGRIEIIGGPQYEPILTMLPSRDRIGQIQAYSAWLERNLGAAPSGMWMPERVWESSLASDLVDAGISYTVLDDFHFRAAGLEDSSLSSYYLTEDDGRVLRIFPGSEHLRYTIPFQPASETIDYCREVAEKSPGAILTFGDDGEKFGTWPDTKTHVYDDGWLRSFFDALTDNADWLQTATLGQAVQQTAAAGKIYLPDCSYREMTEWALPIRAQTQFEDVVHALEDHQRWKDLKSFVRGGYWRNFKTKYDETNEMYARMMNVSKRLCEAEEAGADAGELSVIRDHLYRGQCNCPYWHGAFGGIYLPHLRNAIFNHLIQADTRLDQVMDSERTAVQATAEDYNFDGLQEVRLSNNQLCAWLAPARGGRRGRGGGGGAAGRRQARGGLNLTSLPYIHRQIEPTDILSLEAIEIIENNADILMEEVGVIYSEDEEALQMWKDAGADVQGERVHFPKGLCRELMKTAPATFTQHARNPERNVEIGGKSTVFAPVYGPPFVRDLDEERRYETIEDFQNFS